MVSQNPASAFDVPVLPLGYWASFKIVRCRPCLAAAPRCDLFVARLPVLQLGGFGA